MEFKGSTSFKLQPSFLLSVHCTIIFLEIEHLYFFGIPMIFRFSFGIFSRFGLHISRISFLLNEAFDLEDVGGLHEGGQEILGHPGLPSVDELDQGGEGKGVDVVQVDGWLLWQVGQEVPGSEKKNYLRINLWKPT